MVNYDIKWYTNKKQEDYLYWVDDIFSTLGIYYNKFIEDVGEIPFYYSERALVGHLATASYKCGCYYTLQDYRTELNRYPDLWLTMEPRGKSYDVLFEVKKEIMSIDYHKRKLGNLFSDRVTKIQKDYMPISRCEKVKYQCVLEAIRIYYSKNWWKENGKDEISYNKKLKKLKTKIFSLSFNNNNNTPDFCFYYKIPYNNLKGNLKKYGWDKKKYPLLGILWFGSFQKVKQTPV